MTQGRRVGSFCSTHLQQAQGFEGRRLYAPPWQIAAVDAEEEAFGRTFILCSYCRVVSLRQRTQNGILPSKAIMGYPHCSVHQAEITQLMDERIPPELRWSDWAFHELVQIVDLMHPVTQRCLACTHVSIAYLKGRMNSS
jgi:hypothetical protein